MKVLALLVVNGEVSETRAKLKAQGFDVFHVAPSLSPGLIYVKMFLNEEQEAFLRLTYGDKKVHDLTNK